MYICFSVFFGKQRNVWSKAAIPLAICRRSDLCFGGCVIFWFLNPNETTALLSGPSKGYSCDCLKMWVWYRDIDKQSSKTNIYIDMFIACSTTGNQFSEHKFNPQTSTNVFPEWKKYWVMAKKLRGSNPNPKPKWISCFLLQVRLFGIHPRLYFTKKAIAGLHWGWRSCALMWCALLPVVILHNLFRFAGALERNGMQEKTTRGLDMIYNQKRFGYFFLKTSFGTFESSSSIACTTAQLKHVSGRSFFSAFETPWKFKQYRTYRECILMKALGFLCQTIVPFVSVSHQIHFNWSQGARDIDVISTYLWKE